MMAGGPFLLEKAGGSLVVGWTEAVEGWRVMWLTLAGMVMVVGYRVETLV
jgi:hypothetical protein